MQKVKNKAECFKKKNSAEYTAELFFYYRAALPFIHESHVYLFRSSKQLRQEGPVPFPCREIQHLPVMHPDELAFTAFRWFISACFDKGLDCRTKAVRKSEFKPTFKVIKYNKQYMNGDKNEQTCFTCIHKKESYCPHFGNPDWTCHREEFEMCECKMCCGIAKKENRQLQDNNAEHKVSYAVPFKKVAV